MKRLLFIIAMSAAMFVACSPDEGKLPVELTLTSEAFLDFKSEGGEGVITYKLENAKKNAKPSADSSVDWITNIKVDDKITFTVAQNEVDEPRVGSIYVAYGDKSFNVVVNQAAYIVPDVEFTANELNGEYFGLDDKSGAHNYFAILSEKGTTGMIDLYLDIYYRLNLYSDVAPAEDGPVTLPVGTYTFDEYDLGEPWTFGNFYSLRFQPLEDGTYLENFIIGGTLYVREDSIEGYFMLDNSEIHHVVYNGDLELSYLVIEYQGPFSILEQDYTFDKSGATIRLMYYGDDYGIGGGNWVVQTMEHMNPVSGDYFSLDIVVEELGYNTDNVIGTYDIVSVENVSINTCVAGDFNGSPLYSWYCICKDDYFESYTAPLVAGKVAIEKVGDEYVVTVDCEDDKGNKIQGKVSCSSEELYDMTAQ